MKKEQMVTHDSLAPDVGLVKPITKPPNKRSKVNVQNSLSLSLSVEVVFEVKKKKPKRLLL